MDIAILLSLAYYMVSSYSFGEFIVLCRLSCLMLFCHEESYSSMLYHN